MKGFQFSFDYLKKHRYEVVVFIFMIQPVSVILFTLFQGIDFYDEAYRTVMPWRLVLGDRPFVDEKTFQQPYALFMAPFLFVYHWFQPTMDGVILFMRILNLWVCAFVAFMAFLSLKKIVSAPLAALASFIYILGSMQMSSLDYTSLSLHLLFLGYMIIYYYVSEKPSYTTDVKFQRVGQRFRPLQLCGWPPYVFPALAGMVHGIAIFCYPTHILTASFSGLCLLILLERGRSLKAFATYFCSGLLVGIVGFFIIGYENLWSMWQFREDLAHGEMTFEFFQSIRNLLGIPYKVVYVILFCLVSYGILKKSRLMLFTLPMFPLICFFVCDSMNYGNSFYKTYYGFSGMWLFMFLWRRKSLRALLFCYVVPGLVAGTVLTWSGNWGGVIRFGAGMLPACLVTTVIMILIFDEFSGKASQNLLRWLQLSSVCVLVTVMSYFVIFDLDRQFSIPSLDTRMNYGPYKGIFGTSHQVAWLKKMYDDVIKHQNKDGRILFYPHFPAGYLLTSMRPATHTVWWTYSNKGEPGLRGFHELQEYFHQANLIVKVEVLYFRTDMINPAVFPLNDHLNNYVRENYRLVAEGPTYKAYNGLY